MSGISRRNEGTPDRDASADERTTPPTSRDFFVVGDFVLVLLGGSNDVARVVPAKLAEKPCLKARPVQASGNGKASADCR
jgi:hypothetical protein